MKSHSYSHQIPYGPRLVSGLSAHIQRGECSPLTLGINAGGLGDPENQHDFHRFMSKAPSGNLYLWKMAIYNEFSLLKM